MSTTDMLDFGSVNFNKAIKTTKVRHQVIKEGMTAYKLDGKEFSVSIGNRVVATEIEEDGEYPVYSANVFEEFGRINKQNLTDFSQPSVIWGIDGDWMVNYLPENYPFYPTDHCGVIRVNTDKILPKYLALALQVEGEYERFSRNNRASTARIKKLTLQIPTVEVQRRVVEEFEDIDRKINEVKNTIGQCDNNIKSSFNELFGDIKNNSNNWETALLGEVCDVRDGTHESPKYHSDGFPLVTSKNLTSGEIDLANCNYISKEDYDKINIRSKVDKGDILMPMIGTVGNPVLVDIEPNFAIKNVALIKFNKNSLLRSSYVKSLLESDYFDTEVFSKIKGGIQKFISLGDIRNLVIVIPPTELQEKFNWVVAEQQKNKEKFRDELECLNKSRDGLWQKEFKS